jgi:hypothetical protein
MSSTSPKRYGAAAAGSTARFDVEIDEALDDASDLQISITARDWSFRFALSSRSDVTKALEFLREHTGRCVFSEISIGSFQGVPVLLVKDCEFADRFWLRGAGDGQLVEFTLAGDNLVEFTRVVAQAVQDLPR